MGSATHRHLRSFASVGERAWIGSGSTRMSLTDHGRAVRRLELGTVSAQGWRLDPRRKANSRGHFVKRSRSSGPPPALGAARSSSARPPPLPPAPPRGGQGLRGRPSRRSPARGKGRGRLRPQETRPLVPPCAPRGRRAESAGGLRRGRAGPRGWEAGGGNPSGRPRRGGRSPLRAGSGAATIGRGAAESSARRSGAGRRRRRRRRREGAGLRCAASLERSLAAAGAAAARG